MKRIVCDTGPLVHLFEANLLHLLEAAGEILMPPAVAKELPGVAPDLKLGDLPWLVTHHLRQPHDAEARDWHRAGLLHLGEAEALALARQEQADWFLTDDSAARVVAEQMAVEVHGFAGCTPLGRCDWARRFSGSRSGTGPPTRIVALGLAAGSERSSPRPPRPFA